MSKALPPGRRGTGKKKFEADHDGLIDGIDITSPEGKAKLAAKKAAEEEAARQLELQKQKEASAAAEKQAVEAAAAAKAQAEKEAAAAVQAQAEKEAAAAAKAQAEKEAAAVQAQAEKEAAAAKAQAEKEAAAAKAQAEKEAAEAAEAEKKRVAEEEESHRQATIAAQEKADLDALALKAEQAKAVKLMEEDEELKRIRLAAEEQRRKREMFLMDTDAFSNQMKVTIDDKQSQLKEKQGAEAAKLASGITEQSNSYAAPAREEEAVEASLPEALSTVQEPVVTSPAPVPAVEEDEVDMQADLVANAAKLSAGAEKLFATGNVPIQVDPAKPPKHVEDEILSMPTRIGGEKKKKGKEKVNSGEDLLSERGGAPLASPSGGGVKVAEPTPKPVSEPEAEPAPEPESTEVQDAPSEDFSTPAVTGAAPAFLKTTSTTSAPYSSYIDDDDEDGDENAHRFQSPEKKAAWRAKQDDLTNRRNEFHGAVTYAYGGVFSWSMYGSTEAVDEYGAPYTEYLMRCQWGPSFEDMKPWIVAHRYSEFDRLHAEIERQFPEYALGAGDNKLPALPVKDFFNNFDNNVIRQRREGLENYFTAIITKLPKVLKCELMEEFMFVKERIAAIKKQMEIEQPGYFVTTGEGFYQTTTFVRGRGDGVEGAVLAPDNSTWMGAAPGTENALAGDERPSEIEDDGVVTEWNSTGMFLTADEAEEKMVQNGSVPLDDCQLGDLEEKIFEIRNMMRSFTPKQVVTNSKLSKLFSQCRDQWPCLRATMSFDRSPDVSLIPRAMQVEEDLVAVQGEVKSVVAAYSMVLTPAPPDAEPTQPVAGRAPTAWNPLM